MAEYVFSKGMIVPVLSSCSPLLAFDDILPIPSSVIRLLAGAVRTEISTNLEIPPTFYQGHAASILRSCLRLGGLPVHVTAAGRSLSGEHHLPAERARRSLEDRPAEDLRLALTKRGVDYGSIRRLKDKRDMGISSSGGNPPPVWALYFPAKGSTLAFYALSKVILKSPLYASKDEAHSCGMWVSTLPNIGRCTFLHVISGSKSPSKGKWVAEEVEDCSPMQDKIGHAAGAVKGDVDAFKREALKTPLPRVRVSQQGWCHRAGQQLCNHTFSKRQLTLVDRIKIGAVGGGLGVGLLGTGAVAIFDSKKGKWKDEAWQNDLREKDAAEKASLEKEWASRPSMRKASAENSLTERPVDGKATPLTTSERMRHWKGRWWTRLCSSACLIEPSSACFECSYKPVSWWMNTYPRSCQDLVILGLQ